MTRQKCSMSQNYAASSRIDKPKAMVIPVHPAHQGCTWTQNERNCFCRTERVMIHLGATDSIMGKWNGCKCSSLTYIMTELLDFSPNRTNSSKAHQFCWGMMIKQCNKWATCNNLMTPHVSFVVQGTYLLNILHITASYLEAEGNHGFRNRLLSLATPDILIALYLL